MASIRILALLFLGCCLGHPFDNFGDLPIENPDLFGGDMLGIDTDEDRNAIVNSRQKWPGGVVPYVEDPSLKTTVMKFILERSFDHYKKFTCIKFVPRTTEEDYIRLFAGQGCYSHVGRTGGQQPVSLGQGCGWEGTIIHELAHALGFYHEQNRSDRDDYITIFWDNIIKGTEDQFFKLKPDQNQLITPFDYESLMLYGSLTFSKDKKARLRTMEAKDGTYLRDVLSKGKLSPSDIERIKKLYNC